MKTIASINVVDLLLDAICIVDAGGCFVFVSPAFEHIFGYAPEEVVGRPMIDLVYGPDRERTLQAAEHIMAGKSQRHFENRYIRKCGQIAHIRWSARWIDEHQLRLAVAHDITERKQTEAMQAAMYAISESAHTAKDLLALFQRIHQIIATLLAAENFSVGLYDAQRNELSFPYHVNERHATPGPLQLESAPLCAQVIREGQPLLLGPDSWPTRRQAVSTPADAPLYWLGVPLNTLNGPLGLLVLQSYSEGTRYTEKDRGLLQYVSTQVAAAIERKQMQDRLLHMAQYDPLTQLPNRQLFLDRLRTALARAQREQTLLSLLFLDLDHFKHVNDTLGHAIGDLLLQGVAQRLLECVRGTDTVARLGGDEFVLLLENGHANNHTQVVTAHILQAFGECFDLEGQCLHIRPSIGIASYPEHGSEEFHLLSHADEAMYLSKKNGGNQARVSTRSSARNG